MVLARLSKHSRIICIVCQSNPNDLSLIKVIFVYIDIPLDYPGRSHAIGFTCARKDPVVFRPVGLGLPH